MLFTFYIFIYKFKLMKNAKKKLKRRGINLYNRYFFNPKETIELIVEQYDKGETIDESMCSVVFDIVDNNLMKQIYELIIYYPNKLRELKIINDQTIKDFYNTYGSCIDIMKSSGGRCRSNLVGGAYKRALEYNLPFDIISEDLILELNCPILGIPLIFDSPKPSHNSPSLDRVIPELGYVKGNIEVVSMLANQMKSNANKEQLVKFSKTMLERYG